jgi:hypothetical protein
LLASVTPIYAILSQASPDQRQAWAEWLGRDEPAIDFFATLLGAVDELHQLLKPVDGAGEADAAVTAGRPDKQRDRPHKEMSRCPDAEFYHLVTLVLALQRWLRTRPPAARQALGQQLRQSDRMDDADLLASTAGHLYRLLAAAVAQPDSHHLDELVGEDYVVHGCSHPASCRQAAMLADQRDGRP